MRCSLPVQWTVLPSVSRSAGDQILKYGSHATRGVDGGTSATLCDLGQDGIRSMPSWSAAGDIVFASYGGPGLQRCSARDGSVAPLALEFPGDGDRPRIGSAVFE